jgi:hypothetical protein
MLAAGRSGTPCREETDGSRKGFLAVAREMRSNGFTDQYPPKVLAKLYAASKAFPPESRLVSVSWELHSIAEKPEVLRAHDPVRWPSQLCYAALYVCTLHPDDDAKADRARLELEKAAKLERSMRRLQEP